MCAPFRRRMSQGLHDWQVESQSRTIDLVRILSQSEASGRDRQLTTVVCGNNTTITEGGAPWGLLLVSIGDVAHP